MVAPLQGCRKFCHGNRRLHRILLRIHRKDELLSLERLTFCDPCPDSGTMAYTMTLCW